MDRLSTRQWVNIAATVVVIVVNLLANALPIAGRTTGQVSDGFPVVFVPAGYVFSIWGLIYLGLIAFTVYQAMPAQRDNVVLDKIGYLYAVSCAANALWIIFWHNLVLSVTVLLMLVILGTLIAIYLQVGIGRSAPASTGERWAVHVPFSVYLGWISVATAANITMWLYDVGWNGFGISGSAWAIFLLLVTAGLGLAMSYLRQDLSYNLVLIWAFVGIAVKQAALPSVVFTAALLVIVLVLGIAATRGRQPIVFRRSSSLD